MVDVRHVRRFGGVLDRVAGLLLGAHEQNGAAAARDLGRELACIVQKLLGLEEIDDVDAVALTEDEAAHLGVPTSRLVAEMNAGLQQLLDTDLSH